MDVQGHKTREDMEHAHTMKINKNLDWPELISVWTENVVQFHSGLSGFRVFVKASNLGNKN